MIKKNEHLYGLLCMTLSLNPMRVEETVHSNMKEKYNEQMQKMIKGLGFPSFFSLVSFFC